MCSDLWLVVWHGMVCSLLCYASRFVVRSTFICSCCLFAVNCNVERLHGTDTCVLPLQGGCGRRHLTIVRNASLFADDRICVIQMSVLGFVSQHSEVEGCCSIGRDLQIGSLVQRRELRN